MRILSLGTLFVVVLLLCGTPQPSAASDWPSLLVPDAIGGMVPLGRSDNSTMETVSWRVTTYCQRSLWLDVLEPTDYVGLGLSVEPVANNPVCLGLGYLDDAWMGYFGAHVSVKW